MNSHRPHSPFAAAALLGALLAVPAFAQDDERRTFVVTASRVEEDALSVAAQTTIVSAEDIAESGAASLVEALENVAGISFRSYSSDAQAEIGMRGFGENSFGRVLVLVDGRRLNNPDMQTINWLSVPLADVERVEVLQGASSVRYGNNAVGGVVNIITRKAKPGTTSSMGLSAGSFGENREQFSVNVGGDRGGIIATAQHYGTVGYRDRSGYRSASASVRAIFDLSDTLTLEAASALSDVFYEMPGGLSKAQFEADPTQAKNYGDEGRERGYQADLGASWNPTETLSVSLPLSYAFKDITAELPSYLNVGWSIPEQHTDRLVHQLQASPTASWESELGPFPLRTVGGVDVSAAFLDVETYSETARVTRTNAFGISQLSVGPYLTARLTPHETLSIEGGVRYDRSTIAAESEDGSVDDSKTHQAFVYDAGLVYRPLRSAKAYVRYGTLFRYPFTDEQTSLYYAPPSFLADLEAEKGINLEGGLSVAIWMIATLDADLYWMEMDDEIAYSSVTFQNENLDKTRRFGGDLSFSASPLSFLSMKGTYGYVDAVFAAGANEGKRVPLVSEHRLDATLVLKAPFGLSILPSASYRSSAFQGGDTTNTGDRLEAYTVYDLVLRYTPALFKGALEISAEAENLLDSTHAPYITWGAYYPAPGRSFSMGASYRY